MDSNTNYGNHGGKETLKIADKQVPFLSAPKAKTTDHAWKFLRLKFSQLFFSCYVRILEQGSKMHGEKSQSPLWWSISDSLRALLVTFDFNFSDASLKSTSRPGPCCSKAR